MNQTFTLKNVAIVLFLLISNYTFSQFTFINGGRPFKTIPEFNCNGNFYDLNIEGMSKFLNETEMPQELNTDLSNQLKKIKKKKSIANITFTVLSGISVGYLAYKAFGQDDDEEFGSKDIIITVGTMSLGFVTSLIMQPKEKDYERFFDTFNSKSNKKPIEIGLKVNRNENLNVGLALTF